MNGVSNSGVFDPRVNLERLLAAIVESSDDAIISKDLYGTITTWNQAAERIFGYTAEEAIGQNISFLAAPDRGNEMPALLERIRRGEKVDHFETIRRTKSGHLVDVSLTISPIRDEEGRIVGASKIARDVTARKAAEKELAVAVQKLARSNDALGEFAYTASHDLQEPLRSLNAFSQLIERRYASVLDQQGQEYLRNIVSAAERMTAMIRDLLDYSRAGQTDELGPVDSREVLAAVIRNLEQAIAESGAVITSADLPVLHTSEASLNRILQNIVGNAIKYRRDGVAPQIHVGARHQNGFWQFSVTDNGIGIDPKHHERAFGIFKRLHGSKYPGTGIGLSLCRKIVESRGGRIWVESERDKGATFFFTLPVE
jgi:PAS domain S-box-containing protein